jgi:hypothetical protein
MAYKFNPLLGAGLDEVGAGGGSTSPGGSDTQVQFNDGGSFGGSADLTWDDIAKQLAVGGDINLDDGGTYSTTVQMVTATANRVISFPDATGTVALVAGSSGQVVYNNAGAYAGVSTMTFDGTSVTLAGRLINSYTSLASSPAKVFTGTWFTGGTATTTKPHFLIEPSGATSTAWSTSGTGLGVNAASGFAGNLLDLQVNGSRVFRVDSAGRVLAPAGSLSNPSLCMGDDRSGFYDLTNGFAYSTANDSTIFSIESGGACRVLRDNFFGWSDAQYNGGTVDTRLYRDAANTLAQRNGTNAQTYRLYNTYTDASNYERVAFKWDTNTFKIEPEAAGTGTLRSLAFSANGAASTPPVSLTGTWFSGGTSTTTKPALLIEPSGTTSTAWSTSGTGLGVNAASGFAGNLLDLQVGGASYAFVNNGGIGHFGAGTDNAVRLGFSASPPGGAPGMGLWATGSGKLWLKGYANVYLGDLGRIGAIGSTFGFSDTTQGTLDTLLTRDAAGTLAQRNGTNAQTYRLYNTYTDASNYQRTSLIEDSTGLVIDQQYAGTGAARTNLLDLKNNGTSVATITNAGASTFSNVVTGYNFYAKGGTANNLAAVFGTSSGRLVVASAGLVGFTNSATSVTATVDTALKRDQAGVVTLTDGSTGVGYLKTTPVAVSALPAAATVGAGTRGFVNDSTVAASGNFGAIVAGGGANNVPVFSDGTNWLIG